MTIAGHDHLLEALAELSVPAPAYLLDRLLSRWTSIPGPVGELLVAFSLTGISYVRTIESVGGDVNEFRRAFHERFEQALVRSDRPPPGVIAALRRGNTRSLRFDLCQLTDFERDVLDATRRIPAGQTRPYGWIASEIGRPQAVRAVGSALRRNPVPVLIPCHRVTRSDGIPGDYVFGVNMKERLLRAENVDLGRIGDLARRGIFYLASDTTGIVCFPTCHHARRITPTHLVGFGSVGEATREGYRPCRACRPVVGAPA